MSDNCGINRMNNRLRVDVLEPTETGGGGVIPVPRTLFTIWAYVRYKGTTEDSDNDKITRFDEYEVITRLDPILNTKRQINTLQFTVDDKITIYPKELEVDGIRCKFKAYYKYNDPVLQAAP